MENVSVLIRNQSQQYEGLRTSLGLLLEDFAVQMIVLDNAIEHFNEAYSENIGFFDEMGGIFLSNNETNVAKYKFRRADFTEIVKILNKADLIIPF